MPMPPKLPQKWGIPGSEDVRLGRFGSQRVDYPVMHVRRHSILRDLNSAVSSGLGTHRLYRLDDPILFLSIQQAKNRLFRPQKPPQKFYAAVWRRRKI